MGSKHFIVVLLDCVPKLKVSGRGAARKELDMSKQAVYGLRWKAQQLRTEAAALFAEARSLDEQASILETHADDLKQEAVDRMVTTGLSYEDEWLEKVYNERVAMRARGEEIALPAEGVAGMKALLAQENAETLARKAAEGQEV